MNLLFFGMGRIGLPQAAVFANKGHSVYGYDIDSKLLESLRRYEAPFDEPLLEEYLRKTVGTTFHPIADWREKIEDVDAVFFTLSTRAPTAESCLRDQSLSLPAIKHVLAQIFQKETIANFQKPLTLIFRTTLPIGTIDRLREFLEQSLELSYGTDFYIAFVPERLVEGAAITEEESLPKIIGTYCDDAYEAVASIFAPVGGDLLRVSSPSAAEFCKLTDNSYRNTTFAFANEIAMTAASLNLDISEILDAVNHDYDRNKIPRPGFVSGYCLGKDPYIFEYAFNNKFGSRGFQSLWYYGRKTNDYLIDYTVERVVEHLESAQKNIENARITILGLSFKEDVDDYRMSHAFSIIEGLMNHGCFRFNLYDQNLNRNRYTSLPDTVSAFVEAHDDNIRSAELYDGVDAVVVAHRHSEIVEANTAEHMRTISKQGNKPVLIFDGWNVWREARNVPGITYEALGYREN